MGHGLDVGFRLFHLMHLYIPFKRPNITLGKSLGVNLLPTAINLVMKSPKHLAVYQTMIIHDDHGRPVSKSLSIGSFRAWHTLSLVKGEKVRNSQLQQA